MPFSLDEFQRRMLAAIADPSAPHSGTENARQSFEHTILPSQQQTAAERLNVYASAYVARLLEVLRELFPCLRFALGDELFDPFAREYLQAHPPQSYTLHHLADHFPGWLHTTRPAEQGWADFVVDLARLEQAIDQVFDGPGPEESPPFALPEALTADHDLRLRLVPGFRLLKFEYPVSSYYTAWKAGEQPGWPAADEQFVALLRRDYVVRRYELSAAECALLGQLAAGRTLHEALAVLTGGSSTPNDLVRELQRWFTRWTAERFFAAAELVT
ncbi:MAG: DNA-binding domain-containing protein [Pirellulaceae bacterium]